VLALRRAGDGGELLGAESPRGQGVWIPSTASDLKRLFQSQVTKTLNEARTIAEDWRQHALSRGFTDVKSH